MVDPSMDTWFEQLTGASPVLAERLAALRADWAPDEPPATVAMGDLGQAIVGAMATLRDEELVRISEIIEAALERAPQAVQNAIATGLLEAAMSASDSNPAGARFLRALGPRAKDYGRAWDTFTKRRTSALWE